MLVLRTMAKAVYSSEPRGHYALAAEAYLHFTSPIRRYPDLVVHRMLRRLQSDGRPVRGLDRDQVELELAELGGSCSAAEQRAESAERMAVQWKTVQYLASRVGEVFEGTVSGVTDFGLFVQLDEFLIDGLVHISELLDDFYHYEEERHRLVGERTGRIWRLGDRIRVQVASVDVGELKVELVAVSRAEFESGIGNRQPMRWWRCEASSGRRLESRSKGSLGRPALSPSDVEPSGRRVAIARRSVRGRCGLQREFRNSGSAAHLLDPSTRRLSISHLHSEFAHGS